MTTTSAALRCQRERGMRTAAAVNTHDACHHCCQRERRRHLPLSAANANEERGRLQLSTPTTPATIAASANDDDTCRSLLPTRMRNEDGCSCQYPRRLPPLLPARTTTTPAALPLPTRTPTTTLAAALAVDQTGRRAPKLYYIYLLYFIILYYILFNLIKKTRHTRATGVGFQRVTLSRPVPVPAPPIPGYPHGFVNPCHALVGNRKELCEFRICKSVEGSSFGSGGSDLWERGFIGSGVNGWH